MNKKELINRIADSAEINKKQAGQALQAFMDSITDSLKKGDRVTIFAFGSFSVAKRKARNGRNPQTGKEIKIPAKKVVKFKAGVTLAGVV